MKKCAFLSTDHLEEFFVYDAMLFAPMSKAGWECEEVSWHQKNLDWTQYDIVVIRSTWDYQQHEQAFLSVLEEIATQTILANCLDIVRWNINKAYLRELNSKGVPIVSSMWCDTYSYDEIKKSFSYFDVSEVVVKPLVSANADFTFRISEIKLDSMIDELQQVFNQRPFVIQPFLPSIEQEGEYSLFYFAQTYSHGILKQPKKGDFRVQEEHGGQLSPIQPTAEMQMVAQKALAALPSDTLYARVDLIEHNGQYVVMEMELIEPSLYFNMDEASPEAFTQAFISMYGKG